MQETTKPTIEIVIPYTYNGNGRTLHGAVVKVTGKLPADVKPITADLYPVWSLCQSLGQGAEGFVNGFYKSWSPCSRFFSPFALRKDIECVLCPLYVGGSSVLCAVATYSESSVAVRYMQDNINFYLSRIEDHSKLQLRKNDINDPRYFCHITDACSSGTEWACRRENMWEVWDCVVDALVGRTYNCPDAVGYMMFMLQAVRDLAVRAEEQSFTDILNRRALSSGDFISQIDAVDCLRRYYGWDVLEDLLRNMNPFDENYNKKD